MRTGPSYLLFPIAFILAIFALVSMHFHYKPSNMGWTYYDPTFVYALKDTPEATAQESCQTQTVLGFGSSLLEEAVARNGVDWTRWNRWGRYSGPLNISHKITSLKRNGHTDIRMFYPVLSLLPDCEKTIILHTDMFLPMPRRSFPIPDRKEEIWQYLKETLIDSPRFYLGAVIEHWWKKAYQLKFHKRNQRLPPTSDEEFKVTAWRFNSLGAFKEINPEHRKIVIELADKNTQILILDIGRSTQWEQAAASHQANHRSIMQSFADGIDAVHYRHFPSLEAHYYRDYIHLNTAGAEIFRPWLEARITELNTRPNGFR